MGAAHEVRHVLTILAVAELGPAVAFYRAAFSWDVEVETPVYVELRMPGGQRLGLYQRDGFGRNTGQVPAMIAAGELAPCELYFITDDVDAAATRLAGAGARALSPRALRSWGDEAAYFADPMGNVLVVARPAAR